MPVQGLPLESEFQAQAVAGRPHVVRIVDTTEVILVLADCGVDRNLTVHQVLAQIRRRIRGELH